MCSGAEKAGVPSHWQGEEAWQWAETAAAAALHLARHSVTGARWSIIFNRENQFNAKNILLIHLIFSSYPEEATSKYNHLNAMNISVTHSKTFGFNLLENENV